MVEAIGHNAAEKLKGIVQEIEYLDEEIAARNAEKKEAFGEAKDAGFDPKILKKVIQRRRMSAAKRETEDEILTLYEGTLGGTIQPQLDLDDKDEDAPAPAEGPKEPEPKTDGGAAKDEGEEAFS